MSSSRVIIVGGGHASAQLCASLRQEGWTGEILLIGDEPCLPYHRPPLSKAFLTGESALDELLIRKPDFYDKQAITLRCARVRSLDPETRVIRLGHGEALAYDKLVLCLGARPRRLDLPGGDLAGVHHIRDAADVEAIRADLPVTRHAVIVGGGYIGLEAAASLRRLGVAVTVLEAADRVLQRVTAPEVSAFYERVHRDEGVDLRLGVGITALEGDSRVSGVRLADGNLVSADLVIVGIGVIPNVEIADRAGLSVDNGIVIDSCGRTSVPDIYAAGDCTNHFDRRYGRRLRLESVPNAVEQAKSVAAAICGREKEIAALPWFWSDQYDLKLQIAGLSTGYDEVVLRGDPATGRDLACFYLARGRIIAADCVNRPQEFVFSKRAITQELEPDQGLLADPTTELRSLLDRSPSHAPRDARS